MFNTKNHNKFSHYFLICLLLLFFSFTFSAQATPLTENASNSEQQNITTTTKPGIWNSGIGDGFRKGTKVLGVSAGATYDLRFGNYEPHNFGLISVYYGRMIGDVKGNGKWYRGNWEHVMELYGGAEMNDQNRGIGGLTTHIRYNFATGTRFIPYVDIGFGGCLTEIREPDLGAAFQFNEQGLIGANYFVQDNISINFNIQMLHISSAGLSEPNNGINPAGCFLGVNWFF
jgi:hypothetical protein